MVSHQKTSLNVPDSNSEEIEDDSHSTCIKIGDWVYVSGQMGIGPDGEVVSSDFQPQVQQTIENIERILEAAESSLTDVYHITVWLTDMRLVDEFRSISSGLFEEATVTVAWSGSLLDPRARIEIEARALTSDSKVTKDIVDVPSLSRTDGSNSRFANCVSVGDLVYISGQTGLGKNNGGFVEFDTQMTRVLDHVKEALEAGGSELGDMVTMTTWLTDHRNAGRFQDIRDGFLGTDVTTSTRIEANELPDVHEAVQMEVIGANSNVGKGEVDHPDNLPMLTIERDGEIYPRLWDVVTAGDWIFTAGMLGVDENLDLVSTKFEQQVRKALDNLENSLNAAGADLSDLIHTRTYLTDMRYADEYLSLREEIFGDVRATSTIVHTPRLAEKDWLLEVESIAMAT